MPRIRNVFVGPFVSVQDADYLPNSVDVTDRRDALARAVDADHPCTDMETCDIATALEWGYVGPAAGLLSGATECATVDAVCWALAFNGNLPQDPRADWYSLPDADAWCEAFREQATGCDACGGYTLLPDDPSECGHCGAPFPDAAA